MASPSTHSRSTFSASLFVNGFVLGGEGFAAAEFFEDVVHPGHGQVGMLRLLAAYIAQKTFRYSRAQRGVIFGLSNAQAANTLAAVMVGYQLELLNSDVLNGTIVMIFVTCVTTVPNYKFFELQRDTNPV